MYVFSHPVCAMLHLQITAEQIVYLEEISCAQETRHTDVNKATNTTVTTLLKCMSMYVCIYVYAHTEAQHLLTCMSTNSRGWTRYRTVVAYASYACLDQYARINQYDPCNTPNVFCDRMIFLRVRMPFFTLTCTHIHFVSL